MDTKKQTESRPQNNTGKIVLNKDNYYLIIAGVIIIIIGFILMSGGKFSDPTVFNGDELYSTRRITIAPILVILGFMIEIYALFFKRKKIAS